MPATPDTATDRTLQLRDGRHLAYRDLGSGRPVIFLHGWCASRLLGPPPPAGVRLITVDRPGVGGSDRQPGRRLLDWADDLAQLIDALQLDQPAVAGHSAGGPHALACGVRLADRISAVGVICGFAPMDRPGATDAMHPEMRRAVPLFRSLPWLAGLMLRGLPAQYQRDPRAAWEKQFGSKLGPSDRHALEQPGVFDAILAPAVEAMRQGSAGIADELPLFLGRPWGFAPGDVSVTTWLWYGGADTFAPPQMGRYLAREISDSTFVEYPGEGHMLHITHWPEILLGLVDRSGPPENMATLGG
jgi:pimeloyl-ACP methyl ester carboxylesterase